MPVQIKRLPNEPILIATLSGDVIPQDVNKLFEAGAKLADDIGGTVYRITDARTVNVTFATLVEVMSNAAHGQPGSSSDPRVVGVLVGKPGSLTQLYSDGMRQDQYGRRTVPFFEDYDEAMVYLRAQMEKPAAV